MKAKRHVRVINAILAICMALAVSILEGNIQGQAAEAFVTKPMVAVGNFHVAVWHDLFRITSKYDLSILCTDEGDGNTGRFPS